MNQLQTLEKEYRELYVDMERLLFAAGGGGAGYLLTHNSENFYVKSAAVIGGIFLGSQISFKSKQKKQEIKIRIDIAKKLIDKKIEEIEHISNEIFTKKLSLQRTPKQIETKQPKEVKIPKRQGLKRIEKKLMDLNITSDNLHITDYSTLSQIRKAIKDYNYQFCFIDSINMIKDADPFSFEKLRGEFPEVVFAIIMQSTKDSKFKGSNEYAHNSDINIKDAAGKAVTIKNRFNQLRNYTIFENDNLR